MNSEAKQYTPQEEIDVVIDRLKSQDLWPSGDTSDGGYGRAIMMARRLTLMQAGVELPPISL